VKYVSSLLSNQLWAEALAPAHSMTRAIYTVTSQRTASVLLARILLLDLAAPFLLSYQYHLLPNDLNLPSFVPFCALVGGFAGAARAVVLNRPEDFPKAASLRGAFYGALFGFFFICFGSL
jgi:H+/Cl- antiporter ClcA